MRQVNRLSQRFRAAMRRERERPWRRRLGRAGVGLALVLLLLGGGGWALSSGLVTRLAQQSRDLLDRAARAAGLVVREVTAEGRVRTDQRELVKLLESRMGASILSVELNELKNQLEGLPWVKSAAVRRQLPGTLHAVIEEHRPLALWREREGARVRLIDEEGAIVPVADLRPFSGLPLVTGKGAPAAAKELFAHLAREPLIAKRTTVASLVGGRRWNLYLDGRVEVRLPAEGVGEALARLAAEEKANGLLDRAVEAIDLRTPDWIVVRVAEPPAKRTAVGAGRGA
ncbi:MAG: FtsQ-type POTRA domain-containing protein [Geminicoccaceae bacterium]|nr:FtsQ-type POTRA domain-containing protein [Geminicoccaceae bacterium]MDW8370535.1 FtsQ-type POTRA domain-containing protein [Geminicoccaceae bacterium]